MGNEKVDVQANNAANSRNIKRGIPTALKDQIQSLRSHFLNVWQTLWNETDWKLKEIKPWQENIGLPSTSYTFQDNAYLPIRIGPVAHICKERG